jgi:hypothetical protein
MWNVEVVGNKGFSKLSPIEKQKIKGMESAKQAIINNLKLL